MQLMLEAADCNMMYFLNCIVASVPTEKYTGGINLDSSFVR